VRLRDFLLSLKAALALQIVECLTCACYAERRGSSSSRSRYKLIDLARELYDNCVVLPIPLQLVSL